MTLSSAVQARLPADYLEQLTRQGDRSASGGGVNTTVLDAAVADAEAEFADETGLTFDAANPRHIRAGVLGVRYYLHSYTDTTRDTIDKLRQAWLDACRKVARSIGGEGRILPSSSSTRAPSQQTPGLLPEQDPTRWDDYIPDQPRGSDVERDYRW